jgi:hypothetical protein
MTEEAAVNASLERMAEDPAVARALKEALRKLADGAGGPDMTELAKRVLEGRLDLREVGRSTAYAGPLTQGLDKFAGWYDALDEEERGRLVAEARRQLSDSDRKDRPPT